MPIYNFQCSDCPCAYEQFVFSYDDSGIYPQVECPSCSSANKKKVPSIPAPAIFTEKAGTSKMDRFGYRAGYNLENAKDERRAAEAASHMGPNPYNAIDDISRGDLFGEVQ